MSDFVAGFVVATILFMFAGYIVVTGQIKSFEREAVKHGAASYTINPTNGTTTWNWNK
jgi:hydrogenase/urease accessory protein HupE